MTTRVLAIFGILAAAVATLGCTPDCTAICEERNSCPGVTKDDCKLCTNYEAVNTKGLCEDQFMDLLECYEKRDDVCKTGDVVCAKRAGEYTDCVAGYCQSKQADKGVDPLPTDQTDKDCIALGM